MNSKKYDNSLNLLKTSFPMRGNLPKREPEFYESLEGRKIYRRLIDKNEGRPKYILHDGPPYANGKIHLGTALNKILKDFIIRQKNMSGYCAPFIPGWDTHGLPIELKALKFAKKNKNEVTKAELRCICEKFALKCVEEQKLQFKSLGILGDFESPYLTLNKEFEAKQIELFGRMFEKGYIYKGLKPVYYCSNCATALAESEVEYENDKCCSLYVKFKVEEDYGFFEKLGIKSSSVYFVIWTTTGWTLPANVAVCLGKGYEYSLVRCEGNYFVVASALVEETFKFAMKEDYEVIGNYSGLCFEKMILKAPFTNRNSLVIVGEHVTLDSGTGCVHTAPGHGVEDFEVCKNYENLPIIVVVDKDGRLNEGAGKFSGLLVEDSGDAIVAELEASGLLFASKKIEHKYPHCWRCKKPVLFMATEQWFCLIDGFKNDVLLAIDRVNWIPEWGKTRIENMVKDRTDWCISRQRSWGVPIPVFYCCDCKEPVLNKKIIDSVADIFKKFGSNSWFLKEASEFLPAGFCCSRCGCQKFYKEEDIMDVWFDSGCSHAAVLEGSAVLNWPADLYLEGADQYRGWFQSSLLTSVAVKGGAPYRSVCTHGWVVDGNGRKMSKSLANGVAPEKILEKYGSDILRLWVASSDYHSDVRISEEIFSQLVEVYRKIRNTARFIIGNIGDFNPSKDIVKIDELLEFDRWAIYKLNIFLKTAKNAYDKFEFYSLYHALHNFCVVDMSNYYLDVVKDRLYCDLKDGFSRRAAQTTMFLILDALVRVVAPILSFTSEEIWSFMPHRSCDVLDSVVLNEILWKLDLKFDDGFVDRWSKIDRVRDVVKKSLELKRDEKFIGSSLEAKVVIKSVGREYEFFSSMLGQLASVFLVSKVEIENGGLDCSSLQVEIEKADGRKCERCWSYSEEVGKNEIYSTLCCRCIEVMEKM